MVDQKKIPILEAVRAHQALERVSLHVPGHKAGQGLGSAIGAYARHMGRLDVTELQGVDDLHHPTGPILEAEQLAAAAWGVEETHFLVGGSTVGNLVAILTAVRPGDLVVVARNAHQSVWSGLELAGAKIVPVFPEVESGLAGPVAFSTIQHALQRYPTCKVLILTSPTYFGTASDLVSIVDLAHKNNIVVIVDEAHGAHLAFHSDLPPSAVQVGADLIIHSAHKMLASFTQSGLLHVNGPRVDRDQVRKWLRTLQSSSPSYLLLASVDSARQQMAIEGEQLLSFVMVALQHAKERVALAVSDLLVTPIQPAFQDPFKWVLDATRIHKTGFLLESLLRERFGIYAELATERHVLFVWTYASTQRDIDLVVEALLQVVKESPIEDVPIYQGEYKQKVAVSPIALYNLSQQVSHIVKGTLEEAVGHIVAESLIPYPPGIPYVLPGEVLTAETVQLLLEFHAWNQRIDGLLDEDPPSIRYYVDVVKEQGGEAVS